MNARIANIVYASLTLLAVVAAATAKGYVSTLGEFTFVVLVSGVGLFIAHFWSHLLAQRLSRTVTKDLARHEGAISATVLVPAVILIAAAAVGQLVSGTIDWAVTIAMLALTVLLFAYTWLGTRALLWSLGTAAVAGLMTVFKVVA